jgi:hypothetical protein
MVVIPSSLSPSTKSNAERRLFRSFREIGLDGICFHSLRLSEHSYKAEGELDFVLLSAEGIFALEVKGGVVRRDTQGIWNFTDRFGIAHKRSEGPFDQARSGVYSLLEQIKTHFKEEKLAKMLFGYGVVFPDCTFNVATPEWPSEIVIDADSYYDDASLLRSLNRLIAYWRTKRPYALQLEPREVERLAHYLRPRFDIAPTLANRANEIDREVAALTAEQYTQFDAIERNPRILCAGGAGTGKTFLALHIAHHHAEHNQTVLLVCRSPILAGFLRSRAGDGITVMAAVDLAQAPPHDVLIIDEGQDLLNLTTLVQLDYCVKGGLEKGTWRVFYDINNQSGIYAEFEAEALDLLGSCNPTWLTLNRNCRNTLNIVSQTRLLTSADLGKPAAGDGPKVNYVYAKHKAETTAELERGIYKLLNDDVALSDITILSPYPLSKSAASDLSYKLLNRLTEVTAANAADFPGQRLTFATAADFKGFENKFLFLVDLEATHFQSDNLSLLYVAMTRARVGLTMILNKELESLIGQTMLRNLSLT